jgi:hypothetical protein
MKSPYLWELMLVDIGVRVACVAHAARAAWLCTQWCVSTQ